MPKDSPQRNRRGGAAATDPRASAIDDGTPLHLHNVLKARWRYHTSLDEFRRTIIEAREAGFALRTIADVADRSPEWVRQLTK